MNVVDGRLFVCLFVCFEEMHRPELKEIGERDISAASRFEGLATVLNAICQHSYNCVLRSLFAGHSAVVPCAQKSAVPFEIL
jgi:hypothetical protein